MKFIIFVISCILTSTYTMDDISEDSATYLPRKADYVCLTSASKNKHIKKMNLSFDNNLEDIEFLVHFPSLKKLKLTASSVGDNHKVISSLIFLEELDITRTNITTLKYLSNLPHLKTLKTSIVDIGSSVKYLKKIISLRALRLTDYKVGLSKLQEVTQLQKLTLYSVMCMHQPCEDNTLDFVVTLPLKSLNLSYNDAIEFINPISTIKTLKNLNLTGCTSIKDLSCLVSGLSLRKIDLSGLRSLFLDSIQQDVQSIAHLPNLKILILEKSVPVLDNRNNISIVYND